MMGKLNDLMVRNAKPSEDGKPKKYVDGGLYLLVNKKGKYWRYNYKFLGKQKTVSFGVYPDVGLSDAREAFKEAKGLLSRGVDPSEYKQVRKYTAGLTANNTLEAVAREWFIIWKEDKSEVHSTKIAGRLEKDVYPYLGNRPIEQIEPPEILMLLRRIESRGAVETAHRVKQLLGQVFRYGVATGRAQRDQTADLKGALRSYRTKHFPAITDPKEVGQLLRVIDGYRGSQVVRCG